MAAPPARTQNQCRAIAATPDWPEPTPHEPLRSTHTSTLPELLAHFCASVLVTTYQAGRLVLLRADGEVLNTHFRLFQKPMGMAVRANRIAIGCEMEIREYHNVPAVCGRLDRSGKHDACFLPRMAHATGDIDIHEMAWGESRGQGTEDRGRGAGASELWFVNTRFSCLCTRSPEYSFQPRWRPKFVTQLRPEDCCHLNGLAIVEGRPRYVTALGECDEAGGWRQNKRDGGVLIDVETDEIIARGLSMPHSPRWYRDKLWLLNSGTGGLGTVDLASGKYEELIELPGFTRGLDFLGPFALVGLSQVRDSAVFSGIPIASRAERCCGVWVVNIETGQEVGWVKFEDALQEIFAVQVLPQARFPELVNEDREILASSYVVPDEALADVPEELRK
jgi:uncharacterized protein (TIGR03032 family)